jgi:hypothetical protein
LSIPKSRILLICFITASLTFASNNAPIHISADGDTLYSDEFLRIKSADKPPIISTGGLLGSAGQGSIASTIWGPEVRLTNSADTGRAVSEHFETIRGDTIFLTTPISARPWAEGAPFLMGSLNDGESWEGPWCIVNDDTAQSSGFSFLYFHDNVLLVGGGYSMIVKTTTTIWMRNIVRIWA